MSEDLQNEIEAINSIYGDETIRQPHSSINNDIYILSIPRHHVSLRVSIPFIYPDVPFQILGTEAIGDGLKKGHGSHVLNIAKATLLEVFAVGSVCLFDLLQELDNTLAAEETMLEGDNAPLTAIALQEQSISKAPNIAIVPEAQQSTFDEPSWVLSSPITEKRSVFLARACAVATPAQAKTYVTHLLSTDKRVGKATHNITAYRIRSPSSSAVTAEITFQDCEDDGETAAGGRLLHLLQVMDVWNVLVVVSRWYGGVKLGPDRFRLINAAAREAIVAGGWMVGKDK